jgi:peptidyl-prolyl cis-trans isomerase SurA
MIKFRFLLLLVLSSFVAQLSASTVVIDSIVAVVDEDVVMLSELLMRREAVHSQLTSSNQRFPADEVLNKQIVERLVIESLQLQMAERGGVRISDEELNDALQNIAQQNRVSLAEFKVQIEKDGISYLDMRDQVRRELAISRVQQGIMRRRIQISEQEIMNFLIFSYLFQKTPMQMTSVK